MPSSIVIIALSLLMFFHAPAVVNCLLLTFPLWKMGGEIVFYLVINEFPINMAVVTAVSTFVLLVLAARFIRVIALCMQGVSPFDKAAYTIHNDLVSKYKYGYPYEVSSEAAMSCPSASVVTVSTGILEGAFVANASNATQMTDAVVSSSVGSSFAVGADPSGESADSASTDGSYGVSAVGAPVSGVLVSGAEASLSGVVRIAFDSYDADFCLPGVKRLGDSGNGFADEEKGSSKRAKVPRAALTACRSCGRSAMSRVGLVSSRSAACFLGVKRKATDALPQVQNKKMRRALVVAATAIPVGAPVSISPMDTCADKPFSPVIAATDACEAMELGIDEPAANVITSDMEVDTALAPTVTITEDFHQLGHISDFRGCSVIAVSTAIGAATLALAPSTTTASTIIATAGRQIAVPRAPSCRRVAPNPVMTSSFPLMTAGFIKNASSNTTAEPEKTKEMPLEEYLPLSIEELNQIMNEVDNDLL